MSWFWSGRGLRLDFRSRDREEEFAEVFAVTKHSLWAGEDVLYHCMAGRHRAATYSGLVRALLAFESLPASLDYIRSIRDVEPGGLRFRV